MAFDRVGVFQDSRYKSDCSTLVQHPFRSLAHSITVLYSANIKLHVATMKVYVVLSIALIVCVAGLVGNSPSAVDAQFVVARGGAHHGRIRGGIGFYASAPYYAGYYDPYDDDYYYGYGYRPYYGRPRFHGRFRGRARFHG